MYNKKSKWSKFYINILPANLLYDIMNGKAA